MASINCKLFKSGALSAGFLKGQLAMESSSSCNVYV